MFTSSSTSAVSFSFVAHDVVSYIHVGTGIYIYWSFHTYSSLYLLCLSCADNCKYISAINSTALAQQESSVVIMLYRTSAHFFNDAYCSYIEPSSIHHTLRIELGAKRCYYHLRCNKIVSMSWIITWRESNCIITTELSCNSGIVDAFSFVQQQTATCICIYLTQRTTYNAKI